MKKINKILVIALISITGLSCDNLLDINNNPNYPGSGSSELLITSGIAWTGAYVGGSLELLGSIWSQQYTQNNSSQQYIYIDKYQISNTDFNRVWLDAYAGALPDLYLAREEAQNENKWNNWIMSQVLIAYNYHILVDLYGTVPFSEAIKAQFPSPKFDDGKSIDVGIIGLLDSAILMSSKAIPLANTIGKSDFIYSGDTKQWVSFAKTLKLKLLMRDYNANLSEINTLLSENDFITSDATMKGFQDVANNSNPLYESDQRKLNTQNNLKASATMIAFLKANNDPRISSFFKLNSENDYLGLMQGANDINNVDELKSPKLSGALLEPTDPVYFMSVAEANFLQAECYARNSDPTNATLYYNKGVTAAFDRWGDDATTFLAGVYKLDVSSTDAMLKGILTQKWVAATRCQAWDSFFDINRTGCPALGSEYTVLESDWITPNPAYVLGTLTPSHTSVLNSGEYPKRILLPKSSTDGNQNAPAQVPITTKLWWQK